MRSVLVQNKFMENNPGFEVQVCFLSPECQFLHTLTVASGTTIAQAIAMSGLAEKIPGVDIRQLKVGIYSKLKSPDTLLQPHDRIEVYRPLQLDPMLARRRRADKPKIRPPG